MRSPSQTRSIPPTEQSRNEPSCSVEDDALTDPRLASEPNGARSTPAGPSRSSGERAGKSGNTENQDPTRPPP